MRTTRAHAALLLIALAVAAIAALLMPSPASAMESGPGASGRYTSDCGPMGGAVSPDRVFAAHVVGCGTEVDAATVAHLALVRDAVCDGLTAQVPAARMVDVLTAEMGDRTEAVTLFTDASVWCSRR